MAATDIIIPDIFAYKEFSKNLIIEGNGGFLQFYQNYNIGNYKIFAIQGISMLNRVDETGTMVGKNSSGCYCYSYRVRDETYVDLFIKNTATSKADITLTLQIIFIKK